MDRHAQLRALLAPLRLGRLTMPAPFPVTDAMIAREFRLQHCRGSAVDAITNPLIRRCLALGAEARAAREADEPVSHHNDAKSRAANDHE